MAIRSLGFAIMVVTMGILMLGISAQVYVFRCRGEIGAVIRDCKQFVEKDTPQNPPSQACCDTLKAFDIPCLCKNLPPEFESFMSMEKTMYVANACGCQTPSPGEKCGSYTLPAPSPPPLKA